VVTLNFLGKVVQLPALKFIFDALISLNSPPDLIDLHIYPNMFKQFIVQCLFFQSEEKLHKLFGALCWLSIFLFIYALINLLKTWQ
jgi:hypothetical protein